MTREQLPLWQDGRVLTITPAQVAQYRALIGLARDLTDPEMYAHAVTPEIHRHAARVLQMQSGPWLEVAA